MKISFRSAPVDGPQPARAGLFVSGALAIACLSACVSEPPPPRVAAPATDPRALETDLNARLDALDRSPQPISEDTIAAMERIAREQRERRARAAAAAAPDVVARPAPPPPPVVVAAATPPAKATRPAKAPAKSAAVVKPAEVEAEAAAAPPPAPTLLAANAAGMARTPMSRTAESHTPVDELYARARELELRQQVSSAIDLYREASQRGHAPSSQRLMELYADGAPGVARDYRVAVFFKERAVQQGASFDVWRR